jgi:uncharacterized membrane protein
VPPAALERLQRLVAQSELRHSGEICICIEAGLPLSYLQANAPIRQITHRRALSMFGKLRVWDTAHNNGVLLYVLLAERAIELVADRGLNDKVTAQDWQALVARMRSDFKAGQFEAGLTQAVTEVSELLVSHFPLAKGEVNPNELPDAPTVLDGGR